MIILLLMIVSLHGHGAQLPATGAKDAGEEITLDVLNQHAIEEFVSFYCVQPGHDTFVRVAIGDTDIAEKLNTSLAIGLFIHGYLSSYTDAFYAELAQDYVAYVGSNFCVVDWKYVASLRYDLSASQMERIGNYTADFIAHLLRLHLFSIADVRLFGFSYGAHAAGFAGARLCGQLPLIIALDPASDTFSAKTTVTVLRRIQPGDARMVQAIHTDRTNFGMADAVGHVDYYPNDAVNPQPGCHFRAMSFFDFISCSHSRARLIFRASLNSANKFVGYQCSSYQDYVRSLCAENPHDVFGVYSNNNVTGKLYFSTTEKYPYVKK